MSKYLKVEVSKTLSSDLYLIVPDDFDAKKAMKNFQFPISSSEITEACKETIGVGDWDGEFEWDTIERQGWREVPQEEAEQYLMYDITEKKPARKGG